MEKLLRHGRKLSSVLFQTKDKRIKEKLFSNENELNYY